MDDAEEFSANLSDAFSSHIDFFWTLLGEHSSHSAFCQGVLILYVLRTHARRIKEHRIHNITH